MPRNPLPQRLGLIGDVHAEDAFLEALLRHLASAGLDRLLCVGDVADGRGDTARCCALLQEAGVLTVRGNHDRWLLEGLMRDLPDADVELPLAARAYLGSLPRTRTVETVAGRLLLCHGIGENDMGRLLEEDRGYALEANWALQELLRSARFDWMVCGHTHRRMARRLGRLTVVNPGTLHQPHGAGFAILDLEEERAQFFDIPDAGEILEAETVFL